MIEYTEWSYPNTVRVGPGAAKSLTKACQDVGMKRPLIVTDPGISGMEMVQDAQKETEKALGCCGLFDKIKGNPTGTNVAEGAAFFREGDYDGVIAFGGGSPIDAGKAIAFVAHQRYPLWDYEDTNPKRGDKIDVSKICPTIALPTTAGTGSEVGRASVITDENARVKRTIMHPTMMPKIAILDPDLTRDLPKDLAAATGADALTHCLESLCSPNYHPMSEVMAMHGAKIIAENLEDAVEDKKNEDARMAMLVGSAMGAVGFQRGLGGVHAIAQSLGAVYDKHHGLLNAIILPFVLKANESAIGPNMEHLGRHMQMADPSFTSVLDWTLSLREKVQIPEKLKDIGVPDDEAGLIGRMSFADGCSDTNPIQHSADTYSEIFLNSVHGRL